MRRWPPIVGLPLLLLAATGLATFAGLHADKEKQRTSANASAVRAVATVDSVTDDLLSRIQDVAGLFEASEAVSAREFAVFGKGVVSTSEASSIGWAAVVPHSQRARFERRHGLEIKALSTRGELVRSPRKASYVVATYAVRRDDRRATLGLDLSGTPDRATALARSAAGKSPIATPPITFVDGHRGFVVYMPVFRTSGTALGSTPIGYAVGSIRVDDLTTSLRQRLSDSDGFVLAQGGAPLVALGARKATSDVVTRRIENAGQVWEIRSWAPPTGIGMGLVALVVGLLLTLLITLVTFLILRSSQHARALAEAQARERELRLAVHERRSAVAEQRFEHVFDSATLGMALTDLEGRYVKVNQAFCELVDRPESELIGSTPELVTHPEDARQAMTRHADLARGAIKTAESDRRYVTPGGEVVWVTLRATALTDADGKVELVLAQAIDISDRRATEERLQHIATHDTLTGLPNRRAFDHALAHHLSLGRRYDPDGALLIFDLDNFKGINDRLGHRQGDAMLRRVAEALRGQLRESDVAGRLGGDEFAVLLPRGGVSEVEAVASRLVRSISAVGSSRHLEGLPDLTCSVGIALLHTRDCSLEEVTDQADMAMYAAKSAGGNRFVVFSDGPAPAVT